MYVSRGNIIVFHWINISLFLVVSISAHTQQADTIVIRQLHNKAIQYLNAYPDSLLYYRDSSFHMAQRAHDPIGVIDGHFDLGSYYWIKGDYAKAIESYNLAHKVSTESKETGKLTDIYNSLGMVYSQLGDYPKAINYFLESLKVSRAATKTGSMASVLSSLAVAYRNSGNIAEALSSYKQSLQLYLNLKNYLSAAECYTNIGNIFLMKEKYDSALVFQRQALSIFDSLKSLRGQAECNHNIALIYLKQEKTEEAFVHAQKALAISQSLDFFPMQIAALRLIGLVKMFQKKLYEAEGILKQAIELAKEKNSVPELVNLYKDISDCYKKLGRGNDALYYFENYSSLKDSIFNLQTATALSNLRLAYEIEKKEATTPLLKLNNEISFVERNFAIIGGVLILLMAGLIVARQRLKIRLSSQLMRNQEELLLTQKAVAFLELKNSKLKEEELQRELDFKNQSLTTYALNLVQKNEILEEVRVSVEQIIKAPEDQSQFKHLNKLVEYSLSLDKDWEDFKHYFSDVHQGFFSALQSRFPDLSGSEIKLCALLRLNMSMKQVATILRISPESVKMARHRLRKKFNLHTEDNLVSFIMSI